MERTTNNHEQRFLELIAGPPKSVGSRFIRALLRVASFGYLSAVAIRNFMYDVGLKKSHGVTEPVISVGNLTTGGTGKTPTVALLVDLLKSAGHRPGIISRGYRELAEGGNDEARVLELLCPGTPHVQNRDRVAAAHEVAGKHDCTVIIADDAFQHRRLKRDLDIVLVDALNPWGHDALLPRGLLREPLSALRRAHVVILSRADLVDDDSRAGIWQVVQKNNPMAATVELSFTPEELIDKTGSRSTIATLHDSSHANIGSEDRHGVLAFCGIGNPDGFRKTLAAASIPVCELVVFPDHHHYDHDDLQKLCAMAEKRTATALVTTVKDLVKIDADWIGSVPLLALNIKAEVTSGESALVEAISTITRQRTR
ncbi:MAG: tetraacyldisaccharide 4'-kinase [Rhodopirellula sp.]|nr:tetraacyldisaccharide 4'-kinase [Rhodopirellula sp.]